MNLQFKFTATKVDEIEKAKGMPINNCIQDKSIGNLILFLEKGLVNGDRVGCTKNEAMSNIDEYLEDPEHDTDELLMDIMEALVEGGFLSRQLNMKEIRASAQEMMNKTTSRMKETSAKM